MCSSDLHGNLVVESNNSNVRALTVDGNVDYTTNSNESALAFCEITGNLTVLSNNFTGLSCIIWGNVTIDGNNAVLVDLGVAGEWDVDPSSTCEGCYSFDDANDDGELAESEKGDTLPCGNGNGNGTP